MLCGVEINEGPEKSDGEGVGKTAIEAQSLLKIYCAFLLRFLFLIMQQRQTY